MAGSASTRLRLDWGRGRRPCSEKRPGPAWSSGLLHREPTACSPLPCTSLQTRPSSSTCSCPERGSSRSAFVRRRTGRKRFDLVDAFLLRRLAASRPADPAVAWSWRLLHETQGRTPIAEIATELGWSHRRLISRFREQIGLDAEGGRARDAVRPRRDAPFASRSAALAEIAYDCGYADQAHLNREFRELAGVSPSGSAPRSRRRAQSPPRVNFVQDGDGADAYGAIDTTKGAAMSHPTVFPALVYDDPGAAIDFLTAAFGAERHAVYDDNGAVRHAELRLGNGIVMFGPARPDTSRRGAAAHLRRRRRPGRALRPRARGRRRDRPRADRHGLRLARLQREGSRGERLVLRYVPAVRP